MRRWASNVICALSLLIFLVAMALWVRSYAALDGFQWESFQSRPEEIPARNLTPSVQLRGMYVNAFYSRGILMLSHCRMDFPKTGPTIRRWHVQHQQPTPRLGGDDWSKLETMSVNILGIQLRHRFTDYGGGWTSVRFLRLPFWFFLLFAIPPVLWLRRRRQSHGRGFPMDGEFKGNAEIQRERGSFWGRVRPSSR
jgi:hypothetical protein